MFRKLLIATIAFSSLTAMAATSKVEFAPATSKVTYVGKKIAGDSHTGEIKLASGHLNFDGETPTSGEFVIDMTTISNSDISSAEYKKKFIDHMNSDDFFATATNKTAKFVTTSIKKVKGDTYTVTGDLTVKGKTAPATFDATITKKGANAVVKFDRTNYDVRYGSKKHFVDLAVDKVISDEVELNVALAAKK
jgi:polyisoprenoid-binding protein YceI